MNSNIISHKDFYDISKKHEFWLWHLTTAKEAEWIELKSLSSQTDFNGLQVIVNQTGIPLYESPVEEVVDFIMYTDNTTLRKIRHQGTNLGPIILGYNYSRFVYSTLHNCYCSDGVLEIIAKLNIDYLLKFETN
jgi:hypothetical protein